MKNDPRTSVDDILIILKAERKYQRKIGNKVKTVGEEILLCEEQLSQARAFWIEHNGSFGNKQYANEMDTFRRIATNCIRVMEVHGVGAKKDMLG